MWRGVSGVFLCLLLLLQTAHAQPDAEPGMAGRQLEQIVQPIPGITRELAVAYEEVNRLNNPLIEIDLFSPAATVRSFIWAINNKDLVLARFCILNASEIDKLQPLQDLLRKPGRQTVLLIEDLQVYVHENQAIATFWLEQITLKTRGRSAGTSERIFLRKVDGIWLIVAKPNAPTRLVESFNRPIVTDFTNLFLSQMVGSEVVPNQWKLQRCQTNLKRIGQAFFQYLQDVDNVYPTHERIEETLRLYLRDVERMKVFACPKGTQPSPKYSFNDQLDNIPQIEVVEIGKTILMYEGQARKFEFHHVVGQDKVTNILFGDGNVRSFTEAELNTAFKSSTVRW